MNQQVTATCGCGAAGTHALGMCHTCYGRHRAKEKAYGRWDERPTALVAADRAKEHWMRLRAAGMRDRHIALAAGHSLELFARLGEQDTVTREVEDALLSIPVPERVAEVVPPTSRVPIHGARRRIQALIADGHTQTYLAARLGLGHSNGLATLVGRSAHSSRVTGESVTAARDQQVRELFDELQLTPGPSERSRRLGESRGWPRPLEWDEDEIDRPDGEPVWSRRTQASDRLALQREREERVLELLTHHTIARTAEAVGIAPRSVERIKAREAKIRARIQSEQAAVESWEEVEAEEPQVIELEES